LITQVCPKELFSLSRGNYYTQSLFTFIFFLFIVVIHLFSYSENCSISGIVLDGQNLPVRGAEVYCEKNLTGPLIQVFTDVNGQFEFQNLAEGPTGIFATTEGMSWSGVHINLPAEEHITGLEIVLLPSKSIKGRIVVPNEKGKETGIYGAEVDRFAILGVEKVAIPCSKLTPFGYKRVISDKNGFFMLNKIPAGQSVSVKITHPDYAIQTIENVSTEQDMKISLSKGCVVLGSVFTIQNSSKVKVANSDVTIKNTQPPYESICIKTNSNGEFTIRVNPGVYLCKAETEQLQSAGWEIKQIVNPLGENVHIQVFPSVKISGQVMDAISGEPVPGAKVSIEQGGKKALSLITGTRGKFRGKVVHGQANIKFEGIPGYSIPQPSQLKVVVSGKDEIVLPGVWVKKIDLLKIKVNISQQKTLTTKRSIVSILNPPQLGWYTGNIDNLLELKVSSLPNEGKIIGHIEIPEENTGNVFVIDSTDIQKVCELSLYDLGVVKGKITGRDEEPLSGVIVSCFMRESSENNEYLLWQILSSNEGTFFWKSVVPRKILIFRLYNSEGVLLWQSPEMQFSEGENKDFGNIIVDNPGINMGREMNLFEHSNYKSLCNGSEEVEKLLKGPSVLVFVDKVEIPIMQEILKNVKDILGSKTQVGMIVEKEIECNGINIPIILGQRPSLATTYWIDGNGRVFCETFGLPIIIK